MTTFVRYFSALAVCFLAVCAEALAGNGPMPKVTGGMPVSEKIGIAILILGAAVIVLWRFRRRR